ncbi:MAG TPA: hypothetical protein VGG02_13840 [Chthoniobacterales bacterium]|jgi:hypothetical protein
MLKTASLIEDVAADRERELREKKVKVGIELSTLDIDLFKTIAARDQFTLKGWIQQALRCQMNTQVRDEAPLFFISEAMRHAGEMLCAGEDAWMFLFGMLAILTKADHPARVPLVKAIAATGDDQEWWLNQIAIGEYAAA